MWLEDGKKVDKYSGPRSIEDLKAYIEQRTSGEGEAKPTEKFEVNEDGEGAAILQLTTESFPQSIDTGVTFVKFYAPWCKLQNILKKKKIALAISPHNFSGGHCKRLAPAWQQLAEKFVGIESVKIAKVDCTLQENRDLCSEQDVNGFPTLFIYKNGEKISEYNGSRSLDDLFEFVKTHTTADKADKDEL